LTGLKQCQHQNTPYLLHATNPKPPSLHGNWHELDSLIFQMPGRHETLQMVENEQQQ